MSIKSKITTILSYIALTIMSVDVALAEDKLSKIFVPDMLGADLAYLEQLTSVAKSTDSYSYTKEYKVEGCSVEIGYGPDNTITSLGLTVSANCTFNLAPFFGEQGNNPVNQLTFGQLDVSFYDDCLYLCGNAIEPSVYEHWEGPRAYNFLEILVSSVEAKDACEWADAMMKKEGEDWLMEGKFNCDPLTYDETYQSKKIHSKDHPRDYQSYY